MLSVLTDGQRVSVIGITPSQALTAAIAERPLTGARDIPSVIDTRLRHRTGPTGLQPGLVVRGPDVLDLTRAAPRGPHDLHRRRARLRLHRPHIRHRPALRAVVSAQIRFPRTRNPQANEPGPV